MLRALLVCRAPGRAVPAKVIQMSIGVLNACCAGNRAAFLDGLAYIGRDDIDFDELLKLQEIGAGSLAVAPLQIDRALANDALREITNGDDEAA